MIPKKNEAMEKRVRRRIPRPERTLTDDGYRTANAAEGTSEAKRNRINVTGPLRVVIRWDRCITASATISKIKSMTA